jgi:excisionase family DNA binding protein
MEALLLDVHGAAAVVGVSVSVIRRWAHEGLCFVRGGRGGKLLFARKDLERFVEKLKVRNE